MSRLATKPSGREVTFNENEIIVSKTDLRGVITYANPVFSRISGYSISELVGSPHSLLRHPEMPRVVFKFLWEEIQAGREVFAYVNNLAKNGDNYWVLAHVTPSRNSKGEIVGYHSNRRVPYQDALNKVKPIYSKLASIENNNRDARAGLNEGWNFLLNYLKDCKQEFNQFTFSLTPSTSRKAQGGQHATL